MLFAPFVVPLLIAKPLKDRMLRSHQEGHEGHEDGVPIGRTETFIVSTSMQKFHTACLDT